MLMIRLLNGIALHDLTDNAVLGNIKSRRPVLGAEPLAVQRDNRDAEFGFLFIGNAVDILADDRGGAAHGNKDRLRMIPVVGVLNGLPQAVARAEHHVALFQIGAENAEVFHGLSTPDQSHLVAKIESGMVRGTSDRTVIDENAVGDIADLTSDNRIGAHGLLGERHMQLTELT